jgi:hypothetical protein
VWEVLATSVALSLLVVARTLIGVLASSVGHCVFCCRSCDNTASTILLVGQGWGEKSENLLRATL